jgi:hypothetical protein
MPIAAVLAMLGFTAMPALAQQPRGSRLPEGLFGGGVAENGQSLAFDVSGGGGYSKGLRFVPAPVTAGSTFGHAAGSLRYSFIGSRLDAWASAASSAHYYADTTGQLPLRHVGTAGLNLRVPLSLRTHLTLGQTASYQPLQTVSPFPGLIDPGIGGGQALPIDPDLAPTSDGYVQYDSSASLSHELSRRTGVFVSASYRRGGRPSATGDLSIAHAGGGVTRELARGLGVRLGYRYTRGTYSETGPGAQFDHQDIDVGLDFNRALSLTRRTRLSFATGSVILNDGDRTLFTVTGRAGLSHDIGRSWRASVSYRRGAEFLGTLRAPVVSDAMTTGLGGFVGPRVRAHASVGAARGNVGLDQGNSFVSYYTATGLTVGVTSYLGLDVNYSYYQSEFANTSLLIPGMPDQFERHSLRVSARLWVPLLTRTRRLNAAR